MSAFDTGEPLPGENGLMKSLRGHGTQHVLGIVDQVNVFALDVDQEVGRRWQVRGDANLPRRRVGDRVPALPHWLFDVQLDWVAVHKRC